MGPYLYIQEILRNGKIKFGQVPTFTTCWIDFWFSKQSARARNQKKREKKEGENNFLSARTFIYPFIHLFIYSPSVTSSSFHRHGLFYPLSKRRRVTIKRRCLCIETFFFLRLMAFDCIVQVLSNHHFTFQIQPLTLNWAVVFSFLFFPSFFRCVSLFVCCCFFWGRGVFASNISQFRHHHSISH